MKRIKCISIWMMVLVVIVLGCTKEFESTTNQEGELVLVNLNLTGDVSVEETPLTKALTSNDLIGVQVYQGAEYYAYGLFDDVSKIRLYLHTGKTYKFVCSIVENGKNKVYKSTRSSEGCNSMPLYATTSTTAVYHVGGQYLLPFIIKDGSQYRGCALDNKFLYSTNKYFVTLDKGRISNSASSYTKYPALNRFYGEVSGYTAPGGVGSISIPLKRVGFGLTLSVTGITDGDVSVTIKNSDQTFANNTGITQDTQFGITSWSFFDLMSAWQYADNYIENFTVGVIWNRGVGVTQNLGTKTVQFKRNSVNRVNVKLGESTKSAGIAINVEEPEIINETYTFGNWWMQS